MPLHSKTRVIFPRSVGAVRTPVKSDHNDHSTCVHWVVKVGFRTVSVECVYTGVGAPLQVPSKCVRFRILSLISLWVLIPLPDRTQCLVSFALGRSRSFYDALFVSPRSERPHPVCLWGLPCLRRRVCILVSPVPASRQWNFYSFLFRNSVVGGEVSRRAVRTEGPPTLYRTPEEMRGRIYGLGTGKSPGTSFLVFSRRCRCRTDPSLSRLHVIRPV